MVLGLCFLALALRGCLTLAAHLRLSKRNKKTKRKKRKEGETLKKNFA